MATEKTTRRYEMVHGWAKLLKNVSLGYTHGVATDSQDNVFVFNQSEHAVIQFSPDGDFLCSCGFAQDGDALIIPDLHGRVTVLDGENRLITHLGDNPGVWERPDYPNIAHSDRQPGVFISPHAACVDARGDPYVVEWVSDGRISKFRRVD